MDYTKPIPAVEAVETALTLLNDLPVGSMARELAITSLRLNVPDVIAGLKECRKALPGKEQPVKEGGTV
jgi:hypothetical protein